MDELGEVVVVSEGEVVLALGEFSELVPLELSALLPQLERVIITKNATAVAAIRELITVFIDLSIRYLPT